jgi:hypothetical protein
VSNKSIAFDVFSVEVRVIEGGVIVKSGLGVSATEDEAGSMTFKDRIIPGKNGSPALASRVRKALKQVVEGAFPKPPKVLADVSGQTTLAGTN